MMPALLKVAAGDECRIPTVATLRIGCARAMFAATMKPPATTPTNPRRSITEITSSTHARSPILYLLGVAAGRFASAGNLDGEADRLQVAERRHYFRSAQWLDH